MGRLASWTGLLALVTSCALHRDLGTRGTIIVS